VKFIQYNLEFIFSEIYSVNLVGYNQSWMWRKISSWKDLCGRTLLWRRQWWDLRFL